ncbi:hypothetical protein, partial [Acinetobacter baumannii]|uniref:hypothetical protein n=1 Tax=Acinetobacter baumannii TaxID=470 RepID=UPI0033920895
DWVSQNGFKFSEAKTECIHFSQHRGIIQDPTILLNKTPIKAVKQVKFLGVIFDQKLSFIPHLKILKTKCQQACNLLKVISGTDWGADKKTLLLLYRSLIR